MVAYLNIGKRTAVFRLDLVLHWFSPIPDETNKKKKKRKKKKTQETLIRYDQFVGHVCFLLVIE